MGRTDTVDTPSSGAVEVEGVEGTILRMVREDGGKALTPSLSS